jgi:hypothetical protein
VNVQWEDVYENTEESVRLVTDPNVLAHRGIQRKIEHYHPNEYYGIDLIIKFLIETSHKTKLRFILPHGVDCSINPLPFADIGVVEPLATVLYNNRYGYENLILNGTSGWLVHAPHPFLILVNEYRKRNLLKCEPDDSSILFFPAHSKEYSKIEISNYDEIICRKLESLNFPRNNLHISLPIHDFVTSRHLTYQQYGFKVISFGHNRDTKFLSRFMNICLRYKKVLTAEIGSHVFYVSAMGKEIDILNFGLPLRQNQINCIDGTIHNWKVDVEIESMLNMNAQEKELFSLQMLGWNPDKLQRDFWRELQVIGKVRDYIGFVEPKGMKKTIAVPRKLRRFLKMSVRYLQRGFRFLHTRKTNF